MKPGSFLEATAALNPAAAWRADEPAPTPAPARVPPIVVVVEPVA